MWCARTGALDSVKALVGRGADVNAREKSADQTALMWAVAARHPEVVKALLELRADPRARTKVTTELVYKGFRYITAPPAQSEGIIANDEARRLHAAAVRGAAGRSRVGRTAALGGRRRERRRCARARACWWWPRTAGMARSAHCCWTAAPIRTPRAPATRPFMPPCCAAMRALVRALLTKGRGPECAAQGGDTRPEVRRRLRAERRLDRSDPVLAGGQVRRARDHAPAWRGPRRYAPRHAGWDDAAHGDADGQHRPGRSSRAFPDRGADGSRRADRGGSHGEIRHGWPSSSVRTSTPRPAREIPRCISRPRAG